MSPVTLRAQGSEYDKLIEGFWGALLGTALDKKSPSQEPASKKPATESQRPVKPEKSPKWLGNFRFNTGEPDTKPTTPDYNGDIHGLDALGKGFDEIWDGVRTIPRPSGQEVQQMSLALLCGSIAAYGGYIAGPSLALALPTGGATAPGALVGGGLFLTGGACLATLALF